jgi:uncharacterized protein (DUF1778 family)
MSQSVAINMKADPRVRSLIDRAAKLAHKNRTEFVLEAAVQRAEEVIVDQALISVDAERYQKFLDALDAAPVSNPRLQRVLNSKTPWE